MARSPRPRLIVPVALAVSALGIVGCPSGDDGDSGNETGPDPTGATAPSSGVTEATTESTTNGPTGTSTLGTGATAGELPDCNAIEDEETCDAEPLCQFLGEIGCQLFCEFIEDQATCEADPFCEWDDGGQGGEGSCYAPI